MEEARMEAITIEALGEEAIMVEVIPTMVDFLHVNTPKLSAHIV